MEDRRLTIDDIKKVKQSRHHEIRKSYGVGDAFKYAKKSIDIDRKLYTSIIKKVGSIVENLMREHVEFSLPYSILPITLNYKPVVKRLEDGKVKTNLPVNWKATLDLWLEDSMAKENKTLIRLDNIDGFYVYSLNKKNRRVKNKKYLFFFKKRLT